MPFKLLAVGDLHLGRVPSRLPTDLADDGRRYGPSAVLGRIVEHAIGLGTHGLGVGQLSRVGAREQLGVRHGVPQKIREA